MLLIITIFMLVLIIDDLVLMVFKNHISRQIEQVEDIKLSSPKIPLDERLNSPRNPELRESDRLLDAYWSNYWSSRIDPDTNKPFEYIPPTRHYADEQWNVEYSNPSTIHLYTATPTSEQVSLESVDSRVYNKVCSGRQERYAVTYF